jgi:carbonic anhydrase
MQHLIHGIHQFQTEDFGSLQPLFERLAAGQQPETLFITCSDSRIDPSLLMRTKPGELFILRNAGNLVPPHGTTPTGEAATIEFAVAGLGVKDIVICGHSHCGAMKGLLHPEQLASLPAMTAWLTHAATTRRILDDHYAHLTDDDARLAAATRENVLVQLEHLRTIPAVASRLRRGDLRLHGWVYEFERGEVFAYDMASEEFVSVEAYRVPPSEREVRLRPPAVEGRGVAAPGQLGGMGRDGSARPEPAR